MLTMLASLNLMYTTFLCLYDIPLNYVMYNAPCLFMIHPIFSHVVLLLLTSQILV